MDLVEVNEAFAPQCMAVAKAIGVDMNKSVGSASIVGLAPSSSLHLYLLSR